MSFLTYKKFADHDRIPLMFDLRWETQVEGVGIKLNLCIRYMDDGRIFHQPIRRRGFPAAPGMLRIIDYSESGHNSAHDQNFKKLSWRK